MLMITMDYHRLSFTYLQFLQELFKEIPESDFRNDVSSTQLRAARE